MVEGVTMTADVVRLRPPKHRVSPRALWYWTAKAAVLWIVLLVPQVIWWVADSDGVAVPHVIVAVAWLGVAPAHLLGVPPWRYRGDPRGATENPGYTQTGRARPG